MGAGVVLASGFAVMNALGTGRRKWVVGTLCLIAAAWMCERLLKSYSRGAWVGTFCGLLYLAVEGLRASKGVFADRVRRNALSLGVIAVSVVVLAFWQF